MIQRFPKLSNYSSTQLRAGQSKPRNKHSTANTWTLTKHHVRMESKSTINSTAESWIKISTGRSQLNRSIGSLGPDAASLWPSSLPRQVSRLSPLSCLPPPPALPLPVKTNTLAGFQEFWWGFAPFGPVRAAERHGTCPLQMSRPSNPMNRLEHKPKTNSALPRGHPKARFQQKNLFSYRYSAKKYLTIFNHTTNFTTKFYY